MTTTDLILFYLDDRFHFLQVSREMEVLRSSSSEKSKDALIIMIRYERAMAQRLLLPPCVNYVAFVAASWGFYRLVIVWLITERKDC